MHEMILRKINAYQVVEARKKKLIPSPERKKDPVSDDSFTV